MLDRGVAKIPRATGRFGKPPAQEALDAVAEVGFPGLAELAWQFLPALAVLLPEFQLTVAAMPLEERWRGYGPSRGE
jgi:hypothetical protein